MTTGLKPPPSHYLVAIIHNWFGSQLKMSWYSQAQGPHHKLATSIESRQGGQGLNGHRDSSLKMIALGQGSDIFVREACPATVSRCTTSAEKYRNSSSSAVTIQHLSQGLSAY